MAKRLNTALRAACAAVGFLATSGHAIAQCDQRLIIPDESETFEFGGACDINGDLAIVGSRQATFDATGAAHIFRRNSTTGEWEWEAELQPISTAGQLNLWPTQVEIDGDWAALGLFTRPGQGGPVGAVEMFKHDNGQWTFQQEVWLEQDAEVDSAFGRTHSLDGTTMAVGAYLKDTEVNCTSPTVLETGAVYMYELQNGTWVLDQTILPPPCDASDRMWFGVRVDVWGDVLVVACPNFDGDPGDTLPNRGTAYVYRRVGGVWTFEQRIDPANPVQVGLFGIEVAVEADVVAVSARRADGMPELSGAVYVYRYNGSTWEQEDALLPVGPDVEEDRLGFTLDVSGGVLAASTPFDDDVAPQAGSVYIFADSGNGWNLLRKAYDLAGGASDHFGEHIRIDGSDIIAGSPYGDGSGAATGTAIVMPVLPAADCPGERLWADPVSGTFFDPARWLGSLLPGENNVANFNKDGAYTVSFTGDTENAGLTIGRGDVTFDLSANQYSLTGPSSIQLTIGEETGLDASLNLASGELLADSGVIGADAGASGSLIIDGASAIFSSELIVGLGGTGTTTVRNGGSLFTLQADLGALPNSSAEVLVTGPGSTWEVPFILSVENGSVALEDDGTLVAGSSLFGGTVLFENGTLQGDGTATGELVNFGRVRSGSASGSAFALSGPSTLGSLTVVGDYFQIGTLPNADDASGDLAVEIVPDPSMPMIAAAPTLDVMGNATIAGGLFVTIEQGFAPDPADLDGLQLLGTDLLSGTFDVAFLPALGGDQFLTLSYTSTGVSLALGTLGDDIDPNNAENFPVGAVPTGAKLGDLDGDNDIDLALSVPDPNDPDGAPGSVIVMTNNGTQGAQWQGFDAVDPVTSVFPVGVNPTSLVLGDVDGVNGLDILVTNAGDDDIRILSNDGAGLFMATGPDVPVGDFPASIDAKDTTGDDVIDLVGVANRDSDTVTIFGAGGAPRGSGIFMDRFDIPVGGSPIEILLGNVDNDKDLDDLIVLTAEDDRIGLIEFGAFARRGTTQQSTFAVGDGSNSAVLADLDNDTFLDVATANTGTGDGSGSVSILLNNQDGTFAPSVNLPLDAEASSLAAGDLDDDGDVDLALVADDQSGSVIAVLRNDLSNGQLAFTPVFDLDSGDDPILVRTGDVNGDGVDDVVAINAGSAQVGRGIQNDVAVFRMDRCDGDANADGAVSSSDIGYVIFRLGNTGTPGTVDGDVDGDGTVSINDITFVIFRLGSCQ